MALKLTPPERFSGEFDDKFMASVYKDYASEDKKGNAILTRAAALKLGEAVVEAQLTPLDKDDKEDITLGMTHRQRLEFLDGEFDKAFSHFDVLSQGYIAADQASAFARFLLKDQYVQLSK